MIKSSEKKQDPMIMKTVCFDLSQEYGKQLVEELDEEKLRDCIVENGCDQYILVLLPDL